MKPKKEGFRRLSIAFGILGVLGWIIFFLVATDGNFEELPLMAWVVLFGGLIFAYVIPYFFIKGIYWVWSGFYTDEK